MPQGTKTKEVMEKPESTKKESTKKDSTKRDVTSGIRMQPVRSKTNTQAASSQLSNPPLAQQEVHPPGMVLSGEERLLPTQFIVHPPSPRGDRLDSPRGGAPGGNDDQEDGDFAAHDAGEKDWKDSDEPELRVTLHVPETNLTPEEEMNNFSHDLPLSPSPPPERRRGVHPSVPPLRTSAW
jgi:hypothetical protein